MANGQVRQDGGEGKDSEQDSGKRFPVSRATDVTPKEAIQLMDNITSKLNFLKVNFWNLTGEDEITFDREAMSGLSVMLSEILDKAADITGVLEDVVNFYVESTTSGPV